MRSPRQALGTSNTLRITAVSLLARKPFISQFEGTSMGCHPGAVRQSAGGSSRICHGAFEGKAAGLGAGREAERDVGRIDRHVVALHIDRDLAADVERRRDGEKAVLSGRGRARPGIPGNGHGLARKAGAADILRHRSDDVAAGIARNGDIDFLRHPVQDVRVAVDLDLEERRTALGSGREVGEAERTGAGSPARAGRCGGASRAPGRRRGPASSSPPASRPRRRTRRGTGPSDRGRRPRPSGRRASRSEAIRRPWPRA